MKEHNNIKAAKRLILYASSTHALPISHQQRAANPIYIERHVNICGGAPQVRKAPVTHPAAHTAPAADPGTRPVLPGLIASPGRCTIPTHIYIHGMLVRRFWQGAVATGAAVRCKLTTRAQCGLGPLLGTSRRPPRRFRRAAGVLSPSLVPSLPTHPGRNPAARTPVAAAHDRCAVLSKTIRRLKVATSIAEYSVCMPNEWCMHCIRGRC